MNMKNENEKWRGGVVVIRLPHDPEVPSSNPGKKNTLDDPGNVAEWLWW